MIFEPDEKLKQKMTKNGSVLQFMYSVSGAEKGLAAMGVMFLGIGLAMAALLSDTMGTRGAVIFGGAMAVLGILLAVLGTLRLEAGRGPGNSVFCLNGAHVRA